MQLRSLTEIKTVFMASVINVLRSQASCTVHFAGTSVVEVIRTA